MTYQSVSQKTEFVTSIHGIKAPSGKFFSLMASSSIPSTVYLLTIKLDCDNYMLWKSQWVLILRANKITC